LGIHFFGFFFFFFFFACQNIFSPYICMGQGLAWVPFHLSFFLLLTSYPKGLYRYSRPRNLVSACGFHFLSFVCVRRGVRVCTYFYFDTKCASREVCYHSLYICIATQRCPIPYRQPFSFFFCHKLSSLYLIHFLNILPYPFISLFHPSSS
jgi:hypothetical protein